MQQNHQPPTPAADRQAFERQHCTKVKASALDGDNQTCSICAVRYGDPSPDDEGSPENPVQVNFGNCHHVFGNRCLRQLTRGQEAWSTKCPLCRAHWFHTFRDIEAEELAEILFEMQQSEEWNGEMQEPEAQGRPEHDNLDQPLHVRELYDPNADPHTYLERLIEQPEPLHDLELAGQRDVVIENNEIVQPSRGRRALTYMQNIIPTMRARREEERRRDRPASRKQPESEPQTQRTEERRRDRQTLRGRRGLEPRTRRTEERRRDQQTSRSRREPELRSQRRDREIRNLSLLESLIALSADLERLRLRESRQTWEFLNSPPRQSSRAHPASRRRNRDYHGYHGYDYGTSDCDCDSDFYSSGNDWR